MKVFQVFAQKARTTLGQMFFLTCLQAFKDFLNLLVDTDTSIVILGLILRHIKLKVELNYGLGFRDNLLQMVNTNLSENGGIVISLFRVHDGDAESFACHTKTKKNSKRLQYQDE